MADQIEEIRTTIENTKQLLDRWRDQNDPKVWGHAVALKQQYALGLIADALEGLSRRVLQLERER